MQTLVGSFRPSRGDLRVVTSDRLLQRDGRSSNVRRRCQRDQGLTATAKDRLLLGRLKVGGDFEMTGSTTVVSDAIVGIDLGETSEARSGIVIIVLLGEGLPIPPRLMSEDMLFPTE
jgi:hypothetical protein